MLVFRRRFEMTSVELWLMNLVALTCVCSMGMYVFYLIRASF
jgi:hypothetical protein